MVTEPSGSLRTSHAPGLWLGVAALQLLYSSSPRRHDMHERFLDTHEIPQKFNNDLPEMAAFIVKTCSFLLSGD
jgi:hypothetical protein